MEEYSKLAFFNYLSDKIKDYFDEDSKEYETTEARMEEILGGAEKPLIFNLRMFERGEDPEKLSTSFEELVAKIERVKAKDEKENHAMVEKIMSAGAWMPEIQKISGIVKRSTSKLFVSLKLLYEDYMLQNGLL